MGGNGKQNVSFYSILALQLIDMEDKIIEVLRDFLPKRNMSVIINYDSHIKRDVLIDSLNVIGFLNRIEDTFNVSVLDDLDSLVNVYTVSDLAKYLKKIM